MDGETVRVINNEAGSRFEATMDGEVALLQYRLSPQVLSLIHTEVPAAFEGRGIGGELVKTALEYAKSHGLQVAPLCSFVAGYLKRHPEYIDLVADRYRDKVRQS